MVITKCQGNAIFKNLTSLQVRYVFLPSLGYYFVLISRSEYTHHFPISFRSVCFMKSSSLDHGTLFVSLSFIPNIFSLSIYIRGILQCVCSKYRQLYIGHTVTVPIRVSSSGTSECEWLVVRVCLC